MAGSRSDIFTVIVVSDHLHAVRKLQVPRRWLVYAAWLSAVLVVLGGATIWHYITLLDFLSENSSLTEENARLRSEVLMVQQEVANVSDAVDRIERFDARLRTAATHSQEPERSLAIGPVGSNAAPALPGPAPAGAADLNALPGKLASLAEEAARQERSLRELQEYFDDQRSLLASTPSIWPVRGWVTSEFGPRVDPYTGQRKMHEGLDIAGPVGQPVYAPSDGTVIFTGTEGAYGNILVIDHGYGVKTRYGHLSRILVHLGDRIGRGDEVALIGDSGRSTGPHLHYEVRVNGIAENPRKFILE